VPAEDQTCRLAATVIRLIGDRYRRARADDIQLLRWEFPATEAVRATPAKNKDSLNRPTRLMARH
jgi:hypothetical protein